MVPPTYNANLQIMQTRDMVIIRHEMMHDVRIIPLDGRPHPGPSIEYLAGDSRGHWEGDTLVVDTTNFTDKTNFRGPPLTTRQDISATVRCTSSSASHASTPTRSAISSPSKIPPRGRRHGRARCPFAHGMARSTSTPATRAITDSPTSCARSESRTGRQSAAKESSN